MRQENVRVSIWGFGAMGGGIAEVLLRKKGVDIVGVCDIHPDRVGKSIFEVLGVPRGARRDVVISGDIDQVVTRGSADVVILATDSFTRKAFDKIKLIVERGINVISTAEEMAYPKAKEPALAEELDRLAKANGVSILGTGINPGLMMDLLVILMTGACTDVDYIKAERVNSLSPFGPAVMEEQGVGLTPEEFKAQSASGHLAGHVGFNESVNMICDAIGWKLDKPVEQSMAPIVSNVLRKTKYAEVKPGNVAGCTMLGFGTVGGKLAVEMVHPQQIEPELEGTDTGDYVVIKGTPNVNLSNKPEVPGGIGTIAMCINMIPQVINARPGLFTMIDLPVPRAIMGDMREQIHQ
ncbi:2,4-diaminopentanoate dehydrogenase [Mesoterricola silvestris]|uniref:Dihydrodipicolinate reductase n=1 Tax=Mesoterricola silvestris TaxID=2927979 RepID=A0AA48GUA5_9BACT|nr:2,4-diaminopentanoate dehydrogenase [Mesoterricola silvestris]BDU71911.1 dihydrodipicolinate reductase [Mesoterricola silvestris]